MIPAYNCAGYLRETLASVLAQDPGPDQMQIEVVDDCSTRDDPAQVVAEVGRGRVAFCRQPHNVGNTRNFNTCLQRARGRFVHILHGDDAVRDGFYARMQQALGDHPEAGAAFCRYISMDEAGTWLGLGALEQPAPGVLPDWLEKIGMGQRVQTPCMVVRREAYERLGGFDKRLGYAEDWEMWVRIAARYPVCYEPEPLALYRVHGSSVTARGVRAGTNSRDLRQAIALIQPYLPPDQAPALARLARKHFALACIRRAHRALGAGDASGALAHVREALRIDRSLAVLSRVAYISLRWAGQGRTPAAQRARGNSKLNGRSL
jgi:hypothetical protein